MNFIPQKHNNFLTVATTFLNQETMHLFPTESENGYELSCFSHIINSFLKIINIDLVDVHNLPSSLLYPPTII